MKRTAIAALVVVSIAGSAIYGAGIYLLLTGPEIGGLTASSGGGAGCPNPAFTFDSTIYDPPPQIGWPGAVYSYSAGCYHFVVHTPYAQGTALAGALVSISLWSLSAKGEGGGAWPGSLACGPQAVGLAPTENVYVPPPTAWAKGVSNSSGLVSLTIGVPYGNYSVEFYSWTAGTESGGGGCLNATLGDGVQPLQLLDPVGYVTGSDRVDLGIFYCGANDAPPRGDAATYYLTYSPNSTVPVPWKGPTQSLGELSGEFTIVPLSFPAGFTRDNGAEIVVSIFGPSQDTLATSSIEALYFATPVS